jgi:nucleoside-diphosphate-sugar epimerase
VTHVENLVHAATLALNVGDGCRVYNVADFEPVTLGDLLDAVADAAGFDRARLYIPATVARIAAATLEPAYRLARRPAPPLITRYAAEHMPVTFTLDTHRARVDLGYNPARSYREALVEMGRIAHADHNGLPGP